MGGVAPSHHPTHGHHMNIERKRALLLAYGIAEYAATADNFAALAQLQAPTSEGLHRAVCLQRDLLLRRWLRHKGRDRELRAVDVPPLVAEVRAWLTENSKELDDLLRERRN